MKHLLVVTLLMVPLPAPIAWAAPTLNQPLASPSGITAKASVAHNREFCTDSRKPDWQKRHCARHGRG